MMPVRLEPGALRSRVKHSTTELLHSHKDILKDILKTITTSGLKFRMMSRLPGEIKKNVFFPAIALCKFGQSFMIENL